MTTRIRGGQIAEGTIASGEINDALEKDFTKVRVTTDDLSSSFLSSKLVAGTNIAITVVGTSGTNQTLSISSAAGGAASITSGTITGITDLAVADGGTGASDAPTARTNLGLAIGTDVQAYSSTLGLVSSGTWTGANSITTLGTIATGIWNGTAIGVQYGGTGTTTKSAGFDALSPMTTLGDTVYGGTSGTGVRLAGNTTTTRQFLRQTGTGSASAAPAWDTVTKADVGLSNVENTALSTWNGSANITSLGTVASGTWNGTTIGVANGGTGAIDATTARFNLGLVINSQVQAYSANLQGLGGVFVPGILSTSRYFYSTVGGSFVAMGCQSTGKYAWFGSLSANDDVVILTGNAETIQFDKGTGTIHPYNNTFTSCDLGTSGLPFRNLFYSNQITSSVATGTAPFVITSTTEVANLNASRVAGKIPTATAAANALPLADATGRLDANWIPGLKTVTLSDAPGSISWDMSLGWAASVTLTGTGRVFNAPTNIPAAGTRGFLIIIQDGGGSRTITTWNAVFKWPGGTTITLSTGINKRDFINWYSDGTSIYMLSQNKNY